MEWLILELGPVRRGRKVTALGVLYKCGSSRSLLVIIDRSELTQFLTSVPLHSQLQCQVRYLLSDVPFSADKVVS